MIVIVIDASALASVILKEDDGWEFILNTSDIFISIDLILKEVSNAIWNAVVRRMLTVDDAKRAQRLLIGMVGKNIILKEQTRFLAESLDIAVTNSITVYDALYIALARDEGLPLLTLDRMQARIAESMGIKVIIMN